MSLEPQRLVALLAAVVVSACMGEPGGGGVNIRTPSPGTSANTSSSTTSSSTTTSTTAPTTTSTAAPATTIATFQIRGRVLRHDGRPLVKARVAMGETEVATGPKGWFSFATTKPAPLVVTKRGWSRVEIP